MVSTTGRGRIGSLSPLGSGVVTTSDGSVALRCRGLVRRYGDVTAVDRVDLDVRSGELFALLGPSGCGKTTLLRLVAGFERPDRGTVALAGIPVAGADAWVPPERRRVGIVVQDHALFPHLDVAGNVGFGVEGARRARRARVEEMLALVGLADHAGRYPAELSGGQQQRVALARALAPGPALVLLDEPFSSLDATLRVRVRTEVRDILRAAGATAVLVTHDQEEALSWADRVAVLRDGRVLQVGEPSEVYRRPADAFVARFVGDAELVPVDSSGDGRLTSPLGPLTVEGPAPAAGRATAVLRPELVRLRPAPDGRASVLDASYFGHDQLVEVALDGLVVRARLTADHVFRVGERVEVEVCRPVPVLSG
jgi:iron(III) transport system ATP-binding protein